MRSAANRTAVFRAIIARRDGPRPEYQNFVMSGTAPMTGLGRSVAIPSVCRVGGVSDCRGLASCDPVLELNPVARRHAQQIGRAPDDVVLELADLAVGINQLPHHLDD